ncbi:branched-chain amino acid ABC transporter permease [Campylobacter hyointestinalis subsp. hyointestinalis]|uniref:branched-chain amino acid ABC transporter permease n=1 Tax=Campylobacter hyointestinalis TaxID=198 RepID=UPI000727D58F|nr:branched-chain amino acid ABC transporter permease [Campylobacter hyointestinalis]PPB58396.1 branched-chain amino acid ABC transporter permease [Campylobacter hyointestinalis subsp. hyointestinalis]PPB68229.1 branched-chain amino acid ABC transporter permease [Campylobacter hyointestinalis subsp. hyointestinalis]QCU00395.1 branched-chain amino acid ABC transporter permease [Campylobacter hyointestinalis subsp. hyointestinalis]TWO22147.1 branched-chain amino acid ABC transporter permease [Cam
MNKILHIIFFALAIGFVFFSNYYFSEYSLSIVNNIAIFIILAISYNLINGVTGQFSLEPNGFVAVGAYVAALLLLGSESKLYQFDAEDPSPFILAIHTTNFIFAMIASGICATILALILAMPVFRVRGDYLAIVTLGFGFIIQLLAVNFPAFTNGSLGLNEVLRSDNEGNLSKYTNIFYSGFVAIIAVCVILNLIYSKFGRAMKAVRDDEDAALAMGINTFKIKTMAFCVSAFFEGVGGALLVGLLGSVSPDQFTFMFTFQLLIIIVLGGLGSTTGAILGTILVIGGSEWLRFLDEPMNIFGYQTSAYPGLRMVVFSVVLIFVMLFARRGIMGQLELFDLFKKRIKK